MDFIDGIYGSHMLNITFKNLYESKTETLQNACHGLKYFPNDFFKGKEKLSPALAYPPSNLPANGLKVVYDCQSTC